MKTFLTLLLLLSTNAFAWGPTGHRVVGAIAEKHLDVKALSKVYAILKRQNMAKMANWADEIKSEPETYSHTFNWHYTTWPTEAPDHNEQHENETTGYLLKSINEQLAVLKDSGASIEKKSFALKFVIHLVGDLHMPLHVGNGTDQGGNLCKVLFHNKQTNLHALWDEEMINFTKLSYTEMAKFISSGRTVEELTSWRKGSLKDWALESKKIVPSIYPAGDYCKKEVTLEEMPKLSFEYSYKFLPVVEKRLYQAGLRLAVLLNEALK